MKSEEAHAAPATLLLFGVFYMYLGITFGRVASKAFLLLKPAMFYRC